MSRFTGHNEPQVLDDDEAQRPSNAHSRSYGTVPATTQVHQPNSNTDSTERQPLLFSSPTENVTFSDQTVSEGDWYPTSLSEGISGTLDDDVTLDESDYGMDSGRSWARRRKEARVVTSYALPILVTQLLEYSLLMSSVVTLGHLSTMALAASTLGSMTASVSGFTIIVGMASALDSLLPQAWGTPGGQKAVGLWTLRMTVVVAATLVPIYCIWMASENILLLLRQDPEVARLASLYLRWMSLSLPAYAFNYIVRKYYQSIGLLHIPTCIILIGAPVNAALNYILVWGPGPFSSLRLGFHGAPIATSITFNIMSLFYIYHLLSFSPTEPWFKLHDRKAVMEVLSGEALVVLVRLGVAGVGQTASEWWSWELVGRPVTLASQSVVLVSSSTSYQREDGSNLLANISFAISSGAAVRLGNLLGAGHAVQAEVAAHVSFVLVSIVSCFSSIIFLVFRHKWAYIFNSDPEVVALVAKVLPLVALFQILDGADNMIGTVLRVTGRQFIGAILNVTGYYVIGIPVGLVITFYYPQWELGLLGLWMGLSLSLFYIAVLGTWYVLQTDWNLEVEKVRTRLKTGEGEGLRDGRIEYGN
ncbi:hypothetical protein FRB96_001048 [Tulasnella sp. 330]|nr:hypothetical protein FRB96_001048 [Tulasnella sp. 330]